MQITRHTFYTLIEPLRVGRNRQLIYGRTRLWYGRAKNVRLHEGGLKTKSFENSGRDQTREISSYVPERYTPTGRVLEISSVGAYPLRPDRSVYTGFGSPTRHTT